MTSPALAPNIAAGALLGAGLGRAAGWWRDARALAQPVVVLFIASSAQAFRLRAPR